MKQRLETPTAIVALGIGLGLALDALRRAALAASFPYDLNFWSEDYFMTSVLRLRAGLSLYGPLSDASSSIYAPGGPLLQYALLAPFGLSASVAAHRWLSQVGQLGAVVLGVLTVVALARRFGVWEGRRVLIAGLASVALVLSAYANPVALSLHPIAWESAVLAAATYLLVDWDRRSLRSQLVWAAVLPALGFLAKQSAGPAVAIAFAIAIADKRWKLVPVGSLGIAILVLHFATGGHFTLWGFSLLRAQGLEGGSKLTDALGGMVLWWLPSLVAVIGFAVRALRRRSDADRAWLRAALLPLAYAPLSLGGFAKALGGENNLAALFFFVSILAVAALVVVSFEHAVATLLLFLQIVLLYPRRYVPTARDYANAARICDFAAARMACGERVLLGRGTSCTVNGGATALLDRMVSIHDVSVSGRADGLGVWKRVANGEYDLVLVSQTDLHRFGPELWPALSAQYRAFYTTPHDEPGRFWHDGWQGYASRRMLFFEKKAAAGEHSLDPGGRRCRTP